MQFLTLLSVAAAALTGQIVAAQSPKVPSQDPFYVQPANITKYNPGAIIRGRTLPPRIQGLVPLVQLSVGAVYQYMYRTTDSMGAAVGSVMTYIVPDKTDNSKLLSFSIEYDSANPNCVPSYSIQPGANNSIGVDINLIQAALNNGWHVVTSDYEGLQAQFTAGIQSGNAVLDSLRASLNTTVRASTKLSATAKYALYGYSGGALAAEWATELQPSYAATDLPNLVGTAIGGLTPNLTSVVLTINKGYAISLAFSSSLGLSRAYPALGTYLAQQLLPAKAAMYNSIANACGGVPPLQSVGQDFFSYFRDGANILLSSAWQSTVAAGGIMGRHGVPRVPLFVYKSTGDEISKIADTDALVTQFCAQGVTLQYQRNSFGEHATEGVLGAPAAYSWIKDRFNGVALDQPQKCYVQNVTVVDVKDSGATVAFGEILAATLESALGNTVPVWKNPNITFF